MRVHECVCVLFWMFFFFFHFYLLLMLPFLSFFHSIFKFISTWCSCVHVFLNDFIIAVFCYQKKRKKYATCMCSCCYWNFSSISFIWKGIAIFKTKQKKWKARIHSQSYIHTNTSIYYIRTIRDVKHIQRHRFIHKI